MPYSGSGGCGWDALTARVLALLARRTIAMRVHLKSYTADTTNPVLNVGEFKKFANAVRDSLRQRDHLTGGGASSCGRPYLGE